MTFEEKDWTRYYGIVDRPRSTGCTICLLYARKAYRAKSYVRWRSDARKTFTPRSRSLFVVSHLTGHERARRPFRASRSRCQDGRESWSKGSPPTRHRTKFTCLPNYERNAARLDRFTRQITVKDDLFSYR